MSMVRSLIITVSLIKQSASMNPTDSVIMRLYCTSSVKQLCPCKPARLTNKYFALFYIYVDTFFLFQKKPNIKQMRKAYEDMLRQYGATEPGIRIS